MGKSRAGRRPIATAVVAAFLAWVFACSGVNAEIVQPMQPAARSLQASGHKPDNCCRLLAKTVSVKTASAGTLHTRFHVLLFDAFHVTGNDGGGKTAPTVRNVPRAPPRSRSLLIRNLSWPNAPPA